jgi:hypothetical protein
MVIFAPVALATAALAATLVPQAQAPVAPQRQAQATVTILSNAQVRFSEIERDRPRAMRQSVVRGPDGSVETVKLVEFQ